MNFCEIIDFFLQLFMLNFLVAPNLSIFKFESFDSVLKRRLYEISTPIMKKKLWKASKKTANLGMKVVTFIVTKVDQGANKCSYFIPILKWNNKNVVLDFRKGVEIYGVDFHLAKRCFDLNHTSCSLAYVSEGTVRTFCHENVFDVTFEGVYLNVGYYVKLMPYLEVLYWKDPFHLTSGWEKFLPFKSSLQHVVVRSLQPIDYEYISQYFDHQPFNFILEIKSCGLFDMMKLMKYFRKMMPGDKKPRLLLCRSHGWCWETVGMFVKK